MSELAKILLWGAIGLVVYVYVIYPVLIDLFSRLRANSGEPRKQASTADLPRTTIIIPALNEERWIERKIENRLALDYPHDRLQILVASDGSTDKTVEIAGRYAPQGVEVAHLPERAGKMATLNRVVVQARGDIVVLTDATALLERDALRRLIPYFADARVGCVAGDRSCLATGSPATRGEGLYWLYESWIKRNESRYRSCLGAYGQLLAVRRSLFPFVPGTSDDFYIPMSILLSTGARTVFEPRARARTPAAATPGREFGRKARTHAALLWELPRLSRGLNPWKSEIWWEFWSHHVLRLFVPWAMLAALGTSAFLWTAGPVYRLALSAQIVFYGIAAVGLLLSRRARCWKPAYACFYFVFANAAVAVAWLRWLRGEKPDIWQKTERIAPSLASTGRANHGRHF